MEKNNFEIRIYYEDTDCGGVVYYANFFRFFERARTEFFRDKNLSVSYFDSCGFLFVVVSAEIKFISPAYYDDILVVDTKIIDKKGATFTFIHSIREKKTGRLVVTGSTRMACVNKDSKKPTRMPEELRKRL